VRFASTGEAGDVDREARRRGSCAPVISSRWPMPKRSRMWSTYESTISFMLRKAYAKSRRRFCVQDQSY